eukprot:scaffold110_cov315-Pavlova_lutheri.AAC.45
MRIAFGGHPTRYALEKFGPEFDGEQVDGTAHGPVFWQVLFGGGEHRAQEVFVLGHGGSLEHEAWIGGAIHRLVLLDLFDVSGVRHHHRHLSQCIELVFRDQRAREQHVVEVALRQRRCLARGLLRSLSDSSLPSFDPHPRSSGAAEAHRCDVMHGVSRRDARVTARLPAFPPLLNFGVNPSSTSQRPLDPGGVNSWVNPPPFLGVAGRGGKERTREFFLSLGLVEVVSPRLTARQGEERGGKPMSGWVGRA